jgi:hypothetical protein
MWINGVLEETQNNLCIYFLKNSFFFIVLPHSVFPESPKGISTVLKKEHTVFGHFAFSQDLSEICLSSGH